MIPIFSHFLLNLRQEFRSKLGTDYALLGGMGGNPVQRASIFWALLTLPLFLVSQPLMANEIHDQIRDEMEAGQDYSGGPGSEEAPAQGQFVGNIPAAAKKPQDFLFKNLKNKEYPLEFLLPFMRVSQLFRQRVRQKSVPHLQSELAKVDKSGEVILPPSPVKKVASIAVRAMKAVAPGRESWPEELRANLDELERHPASLEKPKKMAPVISSRPAKVPTRALLESLRAE